MAETRERERGSARPSLGGARWWRTVEMAGRWWLQAEWWPAVLGSAKERREERRARERERDVLE